MTTTDDDKFIRAARRALDRAADEIDAPTRQRLRRARLRALDALAAPARPSWRHALGGVTAASVVAVLGTLLWFNAPPEVKGARLPESALANLDLLATKDGPEFYSELELIELLDDPDAG